MHALRGLLLSFCLVLSGLAVGLVPAAGQAPAVLPNPSLDPTDSPLGPLPPGVHIDYVPQDATFDPLPQAPPGTWAAVPILRERTDGGTAVPAWRVLLLDALGLTREGLAADGLPTFTLDKMAALDAPRLAQVAVPEAPLQQLLQPQATSSAAGSSAMAAAAGVSLPLTIAITASASTSSGAINNAWTNTLYLYGSEFGMPLYQAYVDPNVASVSSFCDMQNLAHTETGYAVHGIGLIIFDSSTLGDRKSTRLNSSHG